MSTVFAKLRLALLLRMVTVSSFVIFIGVIALNYQAIGMVQEMNVNLQKGSLGIRDIWRVIQNRLGDAENARLRFLIHPSTEGATPVHAMLARIAEETDALSGDEAQGVNTAMSHYKEAFDNVVHAAMGNLDLRKKLAKDREELEMLIYDLDNRTMETALGEFILAEMAFFADRGHDDKAKTVLVFLDRFLRDTASAKSAADFRKAVDNYRATFTGILENNRAITRHSDAMQKSAEEVRASVAQGLDMANTEADSASADSQTKVHQAQRSALLWTLVGVILALVLSVLFERALSRRIHMLKEGIAQLTQGDLRMRFPVEVAVNNEIYQVMHGINGMTNNLSTLLHLMVGRSKSLGAIVTDFMNLKEHLVTHADSGNQMVDLVTAKNDQVDTTTNAVFVMAEINEQEALRAEEAAKEFAHIIHTVAAATEQASANVTTMAAAAEEMSANVAEVNNNLEHVSHSVTTVAAAVEELDASLEDVRKRCQLADTESGQVGRQVENANQALSKLRDSAREIGKVVEMIKRIADQTNMLALNASIEAAGAGEAGKGFAVVANEVKELAHGTSQSTQQIASRIQEIQGIVHEVETSMGQVVGGIGKVQEINSDITHAVEEQTRASREISGSMSQVSHSATAVMRNALELENAAREVARAAAEAAQGTGEVARSSSQAAAKVEFLVNHSAELHTRSIDMKEKSQNIFAASTEVQKCGLEMYDIMHRLNFVAGDVAKLASMLQEGSSALHSSTKGFVLEQHAANDSTA